MYSCEVSMQQKFSTFKSSWTIQHYILLMQTLIAVMVPSQSTTVNQTERFGLFKVWPRCGICHLIRLFQNTKFWRFMTCEIWEVTHVSSYVICDLYPPKLCASVSPRIVVQTPAKSDSHKSKILAQSWGYRSYITLLAWVESWPCSTSLIPSDC